MATYEKLEHIRKLLVEIEREHRTFARPPLVSPLAEEIGLQICRGRSTESITGELGCTSNQVGRVRAMITRWKNQRRTFQEYAESQGWQDYLTEEEDGL